MDTKEKIILSSIKLFNSNGMVNVRLQQIADHAGISLGNLTYHFYSKEAIMIGIVDQLTNILNPLTDKDKEFPGLMDFDTQLARYYHILMKYSFFFVDLLEIKRNYPKLYQKRKLITDQIVGQIHHWLKQNEKNEIIVEEPRRDHYIMITHAIWMIITFYLTKPIDHGSPEDSERVFKEMIWTQILPHFTTPGRLEFDLLIERLLDSFTPENKTADEG
ncbi:TetR/AcrR family transcriptional regulator [Cyclobacteriaceae bacterium YHN15]|nr:TetR/AcrR family transcriptional regulator [Cyclobacteriaceae bacterium YHN15]